MKEVILIKLGELSLKGLNRNTFEAVLIKNIKRATAAFASVDIETAQSTMYVRAGENELEDCADAISRVFGIAALTRAVECEKDINKILDTAAEYLRDRMGNIKTFKVETKRSDKEFAYKSPEISALVGERVLDEYPQLTVNVHEPDLVLNVEIRERFAYVHGFQTPGAGGLPVGTGGRASVMISGGIDSPVAAWMMAKRGVELTAIHFASPPYTSELAERKVITLLEKVARWSGRIRLTIVPFTEFQEAIRDNCPEDLFTLIMRRCMIRIAQRFAVCDSCSALISGESLGQVASQTMAALVCTDAVAEIPILRPCIGMDKSEIVSVSRRIDAFETSILPYEDCCTVFTPKHPRTRPTVQMVEEGESGLDMEKLIENAMASARKVTIAGYRN